MLRIFSLLLFLLLGSNAFAAGMSEQEKITALLDAIGGADITFIRNDIEERDGPSAEQFLINKMQRFEADTKNPPIKTAKDFIKYVATMTNTSKKAFIIKTKDGKKVESAKWFTSQLAVIEKRGKAKPKIASKDSATASAPSPVTAQSTPSPSGSSK